MTYLGENISDFEYLQLSTALLMLCLVDAVGNHDLVKRTSIDSVDGITTEDTVGDESDHLGGSLLLQELGSTSDGVRSVGKIIDENSSPLGNITYQHHGRVLTIGDLSGTTLLRYRQQLEPHCLLLHLLTLWMSANGIPRASAIAVARFAPPASGLTMTAF